MLVHVLPSMVQILPYWANASMVMVFNNYYTCYIYNSHEKHLFMEILPFMSDTN